MAPSSPVRNGRHEVTAYSRQVRASKFFTGRHYTGTPCNLVYKLVVHSHLGTCRVSRRLLSTASLDSFHSLAIFPLAPLVVHVAEITGFATPAESTSKDDLNLAWLVFSLEDSRLRQSTKITEELCFDVRSVT